MKKLNLNSKEVLEKKFSVSLKGYNPLEVDKYLDLILQDYQAYETEITDQGDIIFDKDQEIQTSKQTIKKLESEMQILNDHIKGLEDKIINQEISFNKKIFERKKQESTLFSNDSEHFDDPLENSINNTKTQETTQTKEIKDGDNI